MSNTSTSDIAAIDVHAHYGDYNFAGVSPEQVDWMTGCADEVVRRATRANVAWTVASPLLGLFPRGKADAAAGNDEAARVVPATPGLLQWVIIHPLQPRTYEQAAEALKQPHCMGIKIHPEEHCYPIAEHGDAIFSFAAEHGAVVLTHSGEDRSMPEAFIPFTDAHPETTLILAHLGCTSDIDPTHQVRAIQQSKAGNVYVDTSSARSIMPRMVEWAVDKVGADRLLFGTDTPLYHTSMQRIRIDHADLSEQDRRLILRDNALRLLEIPNSDPLATAGDAPQPTQ